MDKESFLDLAGLRKQHSHIKSTHNSKHDQGCGKAHPDKTGGLPQRVHRMTTLEQAVILEQVSNLRAQLAVNKDIDTVSHSTTNILVR